MSPRRLAVLLARLPPESATMTALRNRLTEAELTEQAERGEPEKGRWSQLEQLVAMTVDAVRRLEYVTVAANSDSKSRRPAPPDPVRRPGAKPRPFRPKPSPQAMDLLARMLNGGDTAP